jgi:hypothetical protein
MNNKYDSDILTGNLCNEYVGSWPDDDPEGLKHVA